MNFSDAVKYITSEINKDSLMRLVYISNISYSYQSEFERYCMENKKTHQLSRADIHAISNKAAKHFLDMWLLNADKEEGK